MNQAGGTKCLKALIWLGYHRTGAANGKSPLNMSLMRKIALIFIFMARWLARKKESIHYV
jgi:hypothetical protein